MSETKRQPTTVQRPLEWMKFDPVKFALLADGATLEEEGALIRLLRHLWIAGPLSESAIKRITRAAFEFIHPLLVEDGDLLTLEVVEEARTYGIRRVNQRVEAGKKSAEKRSERSTTVEREPTTVGTDVLSMSLSKSISNSSSTSSSSSEKRAKPKKGPDPNVQAVIDHLTSELQRLDIARSLDVDPKYVNGKAMDGNRFAARSLLQKMAKDYPDQDPLVNAKSLVDLALRDPFHKKNSTKVRYLFNHCSALIAAAKSKPTKDQTNDEYLRAAAEFAARKWATDYPR
jgi:hypothetical protein